MAKTECAQEAVAERRVVTLLVDGDENQPVFSIRDVDENFADYLRDAVSGKRTTLIYWKDMFEVKEAISDLCTVLGDAEKRVKDGFDSRNGNPDRYFEDVVEEAYRRKGELFGLITASVCSGRTFDDLKSAVDRFRGGNCAFDGYDWWDEHKIVVRCEKCAVRRDTDGGSMPSDESNDAENGRIGGKNTITVDFRVDGDRDGSVFKVRDVDENFVAWLGFDPECGSASLTDEAQLQNASAKCLTMFNVLTGIEHRHFRACYRDGEPVDEDSYDAVAEKVSEEMSRACSLITGSVCSRNTWADLMSVYDDSILTFWHFLNSRFVEDWWKEHSTVEVVWRD